MMGWMAPLYHFNVLLPSRPCTSLSAFTVFSLATGTTVWGCVWSLWGWGRSLGGSCCFTLSGNVFIQRVETFGFWAIKVEPPITDEVFLVKDGSVGAEEGVFGKASKTIGCAYVECLAVSFGVGIVSWELYSNFNNVAVIKCWIRYINVKSLFRNIVTSFYLAVTDKWGLWCFSKNWVVSSWLSWDRLQEPVKTLMVITSGLGVGLRAALTLIFSLGWGSSVAISSSCSSLSEGLSSLTGNGDNCDGGNGGGSYNGKSGEVYGSGKDSMIERFA